VADDGLDAHLGGQAPYADDVEQHVQDKQAQGGRQAEHQPAGDLELRRIIAGEEEAAQDQGDDSPDA